MPDLFPNNLVSHPVLQALQVHMDYRTDAGPRVSYARTAPAVENARHPGALNGVDLTLTQGETVSVMGPSGSGKTTLLHILAGITTPTGGRVLYQGDDLASLSDEQRTKLRRTAFGFVFQNGQLLPELPAIENVALPLLLNGVSYGEATGTALQWLNQVGLARLADRRPGEMSGGQMQRVAIARALCIRPRVIFADEPTGALDQHTGTEIIDLLTGICRQHRTSLVLVTHDPNVARHCARTITLRDGRIQQPAAPAEGDTR